MNKYIIERNGTRVTAMGNLHDIMFRNPESKFIGTAHSPSYVPALKRFRSKRSLKKQIREIGKSLIKSFEMAEENKTMAEIFGMLPKPVAEIFGMLPKPVVPKVRYQFRPSVQQGVTRCNR